MESHEAEGSKERTNVGCEGGLREVSRLYRKEGVLVSNERDSMKTKLPVSHMHPQTQCGRTVSADSVPPRQQRITSLRRTSCKMRQIPSGMRLGSTQYGGSMVRFEQRNAAHVV